MKHEPGTVPGAIEARDTIAMPHSLFEDIYGMTVRMAFVVIGVALLKDPALSAPSPQQFLIHALGS